MNAPFRSGEGWRTARLGYAVAGRGRAGVMRELKERRAVRLRYTVGQIRGRQGPGSGASKAQHTMPLVGSKGSSRDFASDSDTLDAGRRADLGIRPPLR